MEYTFGAAVEFVAKRKPDVLILPEGCVTYFGKDCTCFIYNDFDTEKFKEENYLAIKVTSQPCVNPIEPTEGINGYPLSAS